jgi:hypothetical protein
MNEISERQLGAVVLAKCAANDPWFPQPGEALCDAWGEIFAKSKLQLSDLLGGVTNAYTEHGSGFKPLPADIVRFARAIRRERGDRMTPEQRRELEDRRDAELERKLASLPVSPPKNPGFGAEKVSRGLSSAFGTSSRWTRPSSPSDAMSDQ